MKIKFLVLLVGLNILSSKIFAQKDQKPNIIFIVTDDQHRDQFNFLKEGQNENGEKLNLSPNIDFLAENGVIFDNSYVSTSVCTPSRYSILTGNYASRGANQSNIKKYEGQTNVTWNVHIEKKTGNVAKTLQQNGYYTGAVGKNHVLSVHGDKSVPLDADVTNPEIKKQLVFNHDKQIESYHEKGFDYADCLYKGNLPSQYPKAVEAHNMEWVVDGALRFIDKANKSEKPFFLYLQLL